MKKKLLTVAMGAALGVSAVNMPAQADALLFPFFATGNGVFTFLSLRSDAGGAPLAYGFNYLDPNEPGVCTHVDFQGNMTPFDLIQQTVIDPAFPGNGGIDLSTIFGDVSFPAHLPVGFPTIGFVTVEDDSGEGAFGGQAIIVDSNTGTVFAYKGLNDPTNQDDDDFDSIFVSQRSHDYTWYPTDIVSTQWPVLVTGRGMKDDATTGWAGAVILDNGFNGVYDRDENFISGNKFKPVVCIDVITLPDLLNSAQLSATANGGWNWVINTPAPSPVGQEPTGVLTLKQEATGAIGGFTATSFENAFPNLPY